MKIGLLQNLAKIDMANQRRRSILSLVVVPQKVPDIVLAMRRLNDNSQLDLSLPGLASFYTMEKP